MPYSNEGWLGGWGGGQQDKNRWWVKIPKLVSHSQTISCAGALSLAV